MGLISDEIRATAQNAIDALMAPVEDGGLGKHCRLLFDSKKTKCPNCGFDAANKRSNNHYKPGGPQPFPDGSLCPVCMGKGVTEIPVTRDIIMLCNWNAKSWLPMPGIDLSNLNLQMPNGAVQTKGWIWDLPYVLQSRRAIIDVNVEAMRRYTFTLAGEPITPGNIIQGRYFVTLWKREGA